MTRIILIHGMNVRDGGKGSIDKLKPMLREMGKEPIDFDYGWFGMIMVRLFNKKLAQKLIELSQEGDEIIAHSNGCAITARAIDMGLKVKKVTFIHAALYAEWTPPKDLDIEIKVFYSVNDQVGYLALLHKILSPLNYFFGKTYYGAMMTYGATKNDPRMININDGQNHSSGFRDEYGLRHYTAFDEVEHRPIAL